MSRSAYLGASARSSAILLIGTLYMGGNVSARMQVVGLQDSRGNVRTTGGAMKLTDSFCIISTNGSVRVTFKNSSGADATTHSWLAINTAGQTIRYQQYVAPVGDAVPTVVSDQSTGSIVVSAAKLAPSAAACGAGNVFKGVATLDTVPPNSLFMDTVTVAVTPL